METGPRPFPCPASARDRPMLACVLSTLLVCIALPPLSEAQQVALATAIDDGDHQESAFAALCEAMLQVDPTTVDSSSGTVTNGFDWDAAVSEPDAVRGDELRVQGMLQQSDALGRPWDAYREWFVRTPGGRVVAVYVPQEDDAAPGSDVLVAGRFYKRIEAVSRDGATRTYPAVVGRSLPPAADLAGRPILLVILIVGLVACWFLVRLVTRPGRAHVPDSGSGFARLIQEEGGQDVSEEVGLPDDVTGALDELARRRDDADDGGRA